MRKSDGPRFAVEFPLILRAHEKAIIDKRMEIGKNIYNALRNTTWKRYWEMAKTREYRSLTEQYKVVNAKYKAKPDDKIVAAERKRLGNELTDIRKRNRITLNDFYKDVKPMQHLFKKNIDSFTAQKIALRLWEAYCDLMFGDGDELHFKKFGQMNTLEGKSNETGIRFVEGRLLWNGLDVPVAIDQKSPYELMSLKNEISFCRVVRKPTKGKNKYYIQIVFKGIPPPKIDKVDGTFKRRLGKGEVGIDIGTQTIAITGMGSVRIEELADRAQGIEKELRRLQRKQDRSRRATNPERFNADGTIKRGGRKRPKWERSKHYLKTQGKIRELYRKQAAVRRYQHNLLANEIIKLGDTFRVEHMDFRALAKKAKEAKKNAKGKNLSRKRFGKSIANRAPAMMLQILGNKLNWLGSNLDKVNTRTVRASQYDHAEDDYKKKKLSQRWAIIDGHKVQRDMYSSFLIQNVNETLDGIDRDKCIDRFDNFIKLHNMEVQRLTGKKNLSSIAI